MLETLNFLTMLSFILTHFICLLVFLCFNIVFIFHCELPIPHAIDPSFSTVTPIKNVHGVATLQDGWFLVSDCSANSLHLVTPDGRWDRELWKLPCGPDRQEKLWGVSLSGDVCVAITTNAEIYVFDIV